MGVLEARKDLEEILLTVDYARFENGYKPTLWALKFISFIKLVNGGTGEENTSPLFHYDMLDQLAETTQNLFVCFRGGAKTTAIHEYMYLYIAVYGDAANFGEVNVAMYISDTIDNGVKSMRQNLEFRYNNSPFLQRYLTKDTKFTDVRWEFVNVDGKKFCVRGFGASTGVRGFKEYGQRPTWCGFDDLMSDKNAESPTIVEDIRKIIYRAARQAMHPKKRMINWTGTPFNKQDPLYSAASSRSWNVSVYPIAEKYPCDEKDFRGAWEDRFSYEFVKGEYESLKEDGELASFDQELMLRIVSDEDRLVHDDDLVWFSRAEVLKNKSRYNFYITTDFATSENKTADFSVISVYAYSNNGEWLLVDGICKRQLMDKNIEDLFRLVSMYKPLDVGIEVSGQQGGFIPWIKEQMITKNIYFNLAKEPGTNKEGIRPSTKKITRFLVFLPVIKAKKVWLCEEMRESDYMIELLEELRYVTRRGFKSKHDDVADTLSMLSSLLPFKPSEEVTTEYVENEAGTYALFPDDDEFDGDNNSTVF
jgi:predicted phage terminase large subunit-like protein